jgi:hypothetical protein
MKTFNLIALAASLASGLAFAADRKPLPNQAGNDDIDIFATILLDRQEIRQALGADLEDGYGVVKVRVVPKADQSLRVGSDDFTLLARKDGARSPALDAAQITGQAGLILKAASSQPSKMSTVANGTIWGGVKPARSAPPENDKPREVVVPRDEDVKPAGEAAADPLYAALKAKAVPDQESKKPVEGLLYFAIEGKPKAKDLSLIYKSPVGRMIVDFK